MDAAELQAMLGHDERHWWYRGRRRIVRDAVVALGLPPGARILDAGCGSGRTLDELAALPAVAGVSGLDASPDAVAAARRRGHADVREGRVEELPWPRETFDLVLALDVIEHTPDDRATLHELRRVTKTGGRLLITVPAYQGLWSRHDVVNGHYRRYDRRMLRALAADADWGIQRLTSFNALLLPPAAVVRVTERLWRRDAEKRADTARASDLELTPAWLSPALELPLRAEAAWLRGGRRALPAGLSLLAVLSRRPG